MDDVNYNIMQINTTILQEIIKAILPLKDKKNKRYKNFKL